MIIVEIGDNSSDKGQFTPMKRAAEYHQFIEWTALPAALRVPKDQKGLAKKLGVDASTLSDWKKRDNFWPDVKMVIRENCEHRTADVIHALYQNIMKTGNPTAVRLWLDMFMNEEEFKRPQPPITLVRFMDETYSP